MRLLLAAPLLLLGACQISKDDNSTTVSFNQDVAENAAADIGNTAENIGGMIAMTQMADLANTPLYLAVSLFLAFSAVFFASVTSVQPSLYRLIFIAYVVSAVATSLLGIAGYFHAFPGA